MIIDFHSHIFPDKIADKAISHLVEIGGIPAFGDGTEKTLLKSMEQAGYDISVILPVATKPSQFESVNRFAYDLNIKYWGKNEDGLPDFKLKGKKGRKLLSYGGIHPDTDDYKVELIKIKSLGFKGIKLHPDYQDCVFFSC